MEKIYISKTAFAKWVSIILIVVLGILWWICNEKKEETVWVESAKEQSAQEEEVGTDEKEGAIEPADPQEKEILLGVHVTGAVVVPDQVVFLMEGARVADAIEAAGGAEEEADLSQLNLAGYVQDGQRIYVPVLGEKIENIENTGAENQEKVLTNINLATKIELLNLPGIGEAYAERIIQYREENGPFEKIEDIMGVKGIGESKFNDMKDKITVE